MRLSEQQDSYREAGSATRQLLVARAYRTQAAAAKALGYSPSHMSRFFAGKRAPTADALAHWDTVLLNLAATEDAFDPSFTYSTGEIFLIWAVDFPGTAEHLDSCPASHYQQEKERRSKQTLSVVSALWVAALAGLWIAFDLPRDTSEMSKVSETSGAPQAQGMGNAPSAPVYPGVAATCAIDPIKLAPELVNDYQSWTGRMIQVYVDLRIHYDQLCPVAPVHLDFEGSVLVQQLEDANGDQAWLVASSAANAVGMTLEQWLSLLEARQLRSERNDGLLPRRAITGSIGSRILMQDGSELIAASEHERHVLLDAEVINGWEKSGGPLGDLGWPVSHGYPHEGYMRYDFTGGHLLSGRTDSQHLITPVVRQAGLPTGRPPRLLALSDGSIWVQNENRERSWVATTRDQTCFRNSLGEPTITEGSALARLRLVKADDCY